jgi:hypothetical protein
MTAIGTGGKYLAKKDRIIISNIGTGTAIIGLTGKASIISRNGGRRRYNKSDWLKTCLGTTDFDTIMQYASKGQSIMLT